ncbi:MAG: SPOR domain-containing protein, partial [Bacteroidota bacterium]
FALFFDFGRSSFFFPIEAKPAPKLSQGLSSPNQEEFEIGQLEDLDGFGLTDEKKETTPAKVEEEGEATPEESFIEDAPETPAVVSQSNIIVQTGVYSTWSNAQGEASRLERTYNTEAHIDQLEINGRTLYRVRIGPFDADAQATNFLKQYNQQEKDDAIIKTYER